MATNKKATAGEDYTVEIGPKARAQMDADPVLAEFVRQTIARMRQALDGATDETMEERLSEAGFEKVDRPEEE